MRILIQYTNNKEITLEVQIIRISSDHSTPTVQLRKTS